MTRGVARRVAISCVRQLGELIGWSVLERIGEMPGLKLLVKGNHDYWWQSKSKMSRALHPSIKVLQASSIIVNRIAVVATRGWTCPNETHFDEQDARIYQRELGRLRSGLGSLRGHEREFESLIVALHYPPTNAAHEASGFTDLIEDYGASICVYGHLHGDDIRTALTGLRGKTNYHLVSADAANFAPVQIGPRTEDRGLLGTDELAQS
jgi:predicted phosphohydrolase